MLAALLVPLGLATLVYAVVLIRAAIAARATPKPEGILIGLVCDFLDTLGIGSFAPTIAWLKLRRLTPDPQIPSTLVVAHSLPTLVESVIFLLLLGAFVDPVLLAGCIVAVTAGGILGAPLVAKARVWLVQAVVGLALLIAAGFYALANLHLMPGGGTASALPLPLTLIAIAANFVFGVLLNFGIGNYAPTLAMLSLMGMDPKYSFPIMAGGAALAQAGASVQHIRIGKLDLRIALGVAIGGVPAVLVAAFIVKSMPILVLRWLVTAVVVYAALLMLRSAARGRRESEPVPFSGAPATGAPAAPLAD